MHTTPAVIRINHPTEGQYTVLSVHDTEADAQVELVNKYQNEDDVKIERVDPDMKKGSEGPMTDFPSPTARTYGREDIEYDV